MSQAKHHYKRAGIGGQGGKRTPPSFQHPFQKLVTERLYPFIMVISSPFLQEGDRMDEEAPEIRPEDEVDQTMISSPPPEEGPTPPAELPPTPEAPPAPVKPGGRRGLETVIAIAIALVSVTSAFFIWRVSMLMNNAGDADRLGLIDTIKAEAALAEDERYLYQEANFAVKYDIYQAESAFLISKAPRMKAAGDNAGNAAALAEARWLKTASKGLENFSPLTKNQTYRTDTGAFDLEKRLKDLQAENPDLRDLAPDKDFARADKLYLESRMLVLTLLVFGLSLLFYTLAQITKNRSRSVFSILGLGAYVLALLAGGGVEIYFNLLAH
jgi:hypothetical protein